jgi:hypothetical protein
LGASAAGKFISAPKRANKPKISANQFLMSPA